MTHSLVPAEYQINLPKHKLIEVAFVKNEIFWLYFENGDFIIFHPKTQIKGKLPVNLKKFLFSEFSLVSASFADRGIIFYEILTLTNPKENPEEGPNSYFISNAHSNIELPTIMETSQFMPFMYDYKGKFTGDRYYIISEFYEEKNYFSKFDLATKSLLKRTFVEFKVPLDFIINGELLIVFKSQISPNNNTFHTWNGEDEEMRAIRFPYKGFLTVIAVLPVGKNSILFVGNKEKQFAASYLRVSLLNGNVEKKGEFPNLPFLKPNLNALEISEELRNWLLKPCKSWGSFSTHQIGYADQEQSIILIWNKRETGGNSLQILDSKTLKVIATREFDSSKIIPQFSSCNNSFITFEYLSTPEPTVKMQIWRKSLQAFSMIKTMEQLHIRPKFSELSMKMVIDKLRIHHFANLNKK